MFQGILIFAIGGVLLIAAFAVLVGRRRSYEETGSPEDRLTDAEFRRIEFGDEDV
ncbi:MAG: hypothetical protein ACOYOQ_01645 [Microthrixaceae bacterium]